MEPAKKKIKLEIIELTYNLKNLSLKRKNNIIDDDIKKIKKIKIETDKDNIKNIKNIEKKIKLDFNSCGIEYIEFNKKNNKENDDDPDLDVIKQYKKLADDDLIYRYII